MSDRSLIEIAQAIRGRPGREQALSEAVYDIAKAIHDLEPMNVHELANAIRDAAEIINDGLNAVAGAIRAKASAELSEACEGQNNEGC